MPAGGDQDVKKLFQECPAWISIRKSRFKENDG
jgi:hypothetical protein